MTKITELADALLPLDPSDLIEVVQDVAGTPVNKKVPASELGGAIAHKFVRPTSGSTSINTSSAWANLSTHVASFTDLTLSGVAAGDVLHIGFTGAWGSQAPYGILEFATIVGGTLTNYVGTSTGTPSNPGLRGTYGAPSTYAPVGIVYPYTVQAGDVDSGSVTIRPRVYTSGAKTLYHEGSSFSVVNMGAAQ